MKLMLFCLLAFSLQGFTTANAQRISLAGDFSLEAAFSQIEKQSGYSFFYDYNLLPKNGRVQLNLRNAGLDGTGE